MSDTKRFHIGDILSVYTPLMLSSNGVGAIYELLNWMTEDNLFTHQLPRAAGECRPWLLRQLPWLKDVDVRDLQEGLNPLPENQWPAMVKAWVEGKARRHGEFHDVARIPKDDRVRKHPWDEMIEMRGTDENIIVVTPPDATAE